MGGLAWYGQKFEKEALIEDWFVKYRSCRDRLGVGCICFPFGFSSGRYFKWIGSRQ